MASARLVSTVLRQCVVEASLLVAGYHTTLPARHVLNALFLDDAHNVVP